MNMNIFAAWFGLSALVSASLVSAEDELRVATALTSSDGVIWFSTEDQPDFVYYIAETRTELDELTASSTRRRFRVREVMHEVSVPADLGSLQGSWSGRIPLAYILTPSASCSLDVKPEMSQVTQQADMQGRNISANQSVPLCQFSFSLDKSVDDTQVNALKHQAERGTLISAPLSLVLSVGVSVERAVLWTALHADPEVPGKVWTPSAADTLIALAYSSLPEFNAKYQALTNTQRDELILDARTHLFRQANGGYLLVDSAPNGELSVADGEVEFDL